MTVEDRGRDNPFFFLFIYLIAIAVTSEHYRSGEMLGAYCRFIYTAGLSPYRSEKCVLGGDSTVPFDDESSRIGCATCAFNQKNM